MAGPRLFSARAALLNRAVRKGVLGGSRSWILLAALLSGLNPVSPAATVLRGNSVVKGLIGGQPVWRVVGVLLWFPHLLSRLAGSETKVVVIEDLKAGEALRVASVPKSGRRRAA